MAMLWQPQNIQTEHARRSVQNFLFFRTLKNFEEYLGKGLAFGRFLY